MMKRLGCAGRFFFHPLSVLQPDNIGVKFSETFTCCLLKLSTVNQQTAAIIDVFSTTCF
jgi:hypothetical protein